MGATMKSDHIKMKKSVQSRSQMTTRTLVAGLGVVIVLMCVLVPAINGLSSSDTTANNRGMWIQHFL